MNRMGRLCGRHSSAVPVVALNANFLGRPQGQVWETSEPCHAEEGVATYCGLELSQTTEGWMASQSKYVNELLSRPSEVVSSSGSPCSLWREAFDDSELRRSPWIQPL